MVAEVSTLIRLMKGSVGSDMNESSSSSSTKSTALITRDLLGGCCSTLDSKELDLDLQVPSGWEKRLDLKSGKVYLQRSNSSNYQTVGKFQDFNSPPASKLPLSLFEDTKLDLKLPSSSSPSSSSSSGNYHSVCTLEKVKSALERAEKQSTRKRSISSSFMSMASSSVMSMASSSSTSNSSVSSIKDIIDIDHDNSSDNSFAAGCPSCLLYVLISRTNPRCPRCNTIVPLLPHVDMKKPRIDLNISI